MYISFAVLIVLFALAAVTAFRVVPLDRRKALYIVLLLLAAATRIAIIFYIYRDGTETFGTDGLLYHREGICVARQLAEGVPLYAVEYDYTWYSVFVGLIYRLFGVNRYIASFVNAVLALYSALLLLKISINNGRKFSNAAYASIVFLYSPNLLLWTSDTRKESLLIFLILFYWYLVQSFMNIIEKAVGESKAEKQSGAGKTMTYRFNSLMDFRGYVKCILLILSICALMWLCTLVRIYMFLPLAAGILACQYIFIKKYRVRLGIIFFIVFTAFSLAIFFTTIYPWLKDYHAISFPDETGNFASDVLNKIKKIVNLVKNRNIFMSIVNFIILPIPGKVNIADIKGNALLCSIVSIDIMTWYSCILQMIPGIRSAIKRKEAFMIGILMFLLSYILINGLVVDNAEDTIYRYRSVIVGIFLLFIKWDEIAEMLSIFHIRKRHRDKERRATV
ncbi:MAG: hypothetical protein ACM3XR_07350 [Bacillota bacterium]